MDAKQLLQLYLFVCVFCDSLLCVYVFEVQKAIVADTTDGSSDSLKVQKYIQLKNSYGLYPGLCPKQCRCYEYNKPNKLVTDCSSANLKDIPGNISLETTTLLLKNNSIPGNVTHTFHFQLFTKLEYLDLSYNNISRLNNLTFSGLSKLKFLSLAFNNLTDINCLSKGVFEPLHALETLHFHGNCDSYKLKCYYHDNELGDLRKLTNLITDGNLYTDLGIGFRNLDRLRYFKMNKAYCRLGSVTPSTFRNLAKSKLETLDLTSCHIDSIAPNSFSVLLYLRILILTRNDNLCNKGLRNMSIGLNATNIEQLILRQTCNSVTYFNGVGPLAALTHTSLLHLDLERNYIYNMSLDFIACLPRSLVSLSLRDNLLMAGRCFFLLALPVLTNLEYLDGSGQNRYHIGVFNQTNNKSNTNDSKTVDEVNERHTLDETICKRETRETHPADLDDFKQTGIGLRHIPWPSTILLPQNLKYLNASFLQIFDTVPSIHFSLNNSLELWDFSHSMLKGTCGTIYGLRHLKYLNMSHSLLSYLDPFTFGDMKSLYDINLSNNPIGKTISRDTEALFSNQSMLVYLDMSSTSMTYLPWKMFSCNRKLQYLNLAHNFFVTVTFAVESLTSLKVLDISHNSILYISADVTTQFTQISMSSTTEVNLNGNSLKCTCTYKPFVHWLMHLSSNIRLVDYETLLCLYSNNTKVKVMSLKGIYFDIDCVTWLVMTICVMGFFVLLLLFSACAYVYVQRWKLRYLYYTGRNAANPLHPLTGENVEFNVDTYISFDETTVIVQDEEIELLHFATNILYPWLQERQLNVKIREELEGDKPLYKTIPEIIRKCRKVIVFLSKDYCTGFWNVFEFNMAAYEGIYTSRDVIIPIIVGHFSPKDLSPEVRTLVSNMSACKRILQLNANTDVDVLLEEILLKIRS